MTLKEIYEALRLFYNASGESVRMSGVTVEVEMTQKKEETKITRDEIHAALQYKINKQNIRQIDPWTIIITE